MTLVSELQQLRNEAEWVPADDPRIELIADFFDASGEAINEITRLTAENERLRQEVEHYNKSGIVEIAVRNPSVADYMAHWEGRAEKAEAENERLKALVSEWQTARKLVLAEPVANTVTSPSFRDALNRLANAEDALNRAELEQP